MQKQIFFARYGKGEEPDKEGTLKYAHFTLEGQEFGAMDSAHKHNFAFNEAISLMEHCDTQEEIDYYWESSLQFLRQSNAAGSRTNMAYRGRSSPLF